ncbi:MAG: acyl carrier protein [Ardenticatenales bacterium]
MSAPAPAGGPEGVAERTFALIARRAGVEPASVGSDTALASLGIDSLDMAELAFEIEEAFAIEIPDSADATERFLGLQTAGEAADLVRRLLDGGGAPGAGKSRAPRAPTA